MNNARRNKINNAIRELYSIAKTIEVILSDECDAYENMPEGLQCSDRGMASEEAQGSLESAIDSVNDAINCLEEIE